MTEEVKYATEADVKKLAEIIKDVVSLFDSLQTQIDIIFAADPDELLKILKRRAKGRENIGLKGLHRMAFNDIGQEEE